MIGLRLSGELLGLLLGVSRLLDHNPANHKSRNKVGLCIPQILRMPISFSQNPLTFLESLRARVLFLTKLLGKLEPVFALVLPVRCRAALGPNAG